MFQETIKGSIKMSAKPISTGNTPEEDLDKAPLNDLGEPYQYCMILPDRESLVYTDSVDDLLESLIPGYLELDDKEQTIKRIMLANVVASYIQGILLSELSEENFFDEEQWRILYAPKTGPNAPNPLFWSYPVPLIVLDTSYEPYTSLTRPCSANDGVKSDNLVWLFPSDPEKFILSLSEIGHIRLMRNNDL
jgi:hypothetical protein